MIKKKNLLIWILMSILLINGVFAQLNCCYTGGGISARTSCNNGELNLGLADENADVICYSQFPQLKCKTMSDSCTESVDGQRNIYDHPNVTSLFFPTLCKSLHPITDTSCSIGASPSLGSTNSTTGGIYVGSNLNSSLNLSFDQINQSIISNLQSQAILAQCSDAGGQFGFFANKISCERIEGCIYNPYYGGYLTTSFADASINFNYDTLEKNSCNAKISIKQCSDYKTKENCNENSVLSYLILKNITDRTNLELGCNWIESKAYFENSSFPNQNGICISNITSQSKNFDRKKYIERQNLIKNPSFEKDDGWNSLDIYSIKSPISSEPSAFHANKYYDLSNKNISQKVLGVRESVILVSYLYFQRKQFSNEDILLEIKFYDSKGNVIGSKYLSHKPLSNYSYGFGGFEKLKFEDIRLVNGTSSFDFILSGVGNGIYIDAVSVEMEPFGVTVAENEFKSFEIIKSSASTCELCYNSLDLNSCTKTKSNYLGDCSYMTTQISKPYYSNLSSYSGKDENLYLKNFPWKSQALPNSFLFCEMYLEQSSCENISNYINTKYSSLHVNSTGRLCKWNSQIGCFKDSNGDNLVDTLDGKPKVNFNRADFDLRAEQAVLTNFYKYATVGSNISDFALGCDVIPPTGYVYFSAKNQSIGDKLIYSKDFSEIVGSMNININTYDYPISYTESCKNFNFNNGIIFDYKITNSKGVTSNHKTSLGSNYNGVLNVKNFFTDSSGNNLLVDGNNKLELNILDISGNIGFSKTYDFNLDIFGPNFDAKYRGENLEDRTFFTTSTIRKNSSFIFTFQDYSKVASCTYNLNSFGLNAVPLSYYVPSGSFNLSSIGGTNAGGNTAFTYDFKLPIIKTDETFTNFQLEVECLDIYGQSTKKTYSFRADFDTNLVLVGPSPYVNYSLKPGFFNTTFNMNLISSDKTVYDCDLRYQDGREVDQKNIVVFTTPFNFDGDNYFVNITVPVQLTTLGTNNISVTCIDTNGNSHTEHMAYYYDNVAPTFTKYNLIDSNIDGRSTTVKIGNNYYVNNLNSVNLNLTLDGTYSCISNLKNLSAWSLTGVANNGNAQNRPFSLKSAKATNNINNNVIASTLLSTKANLERTCNFSTFQSNLILHSFNDMNVYSGIENTSNYGLREMKYGLEFMDMANNSGFDNGIVFYYDSKIPQITFTSNQVIQDGNKVFTDYEDPSLKVDFKTPSYRNYTCKVVAKWDRRSTGNYNRIAQKDISSNSNILDFKLSEIDSNINLGSYKNVELNFNCNDNFGPLTIMPITTFNINFDNVTPIIKDLSFQKKNVYLVNYADSVNNSLIFDMQDTSEVNYVCGYKFTSAHYNCNSSQYDVSFSGLLNTVPLDLISSYYDLNQNSICRRNSLIDSSVVRKETSIEVVAKCRDNLGHMTLEKNTSVNIVYVKSELISLDFTYGFGTQKAYPQVKVTNPYDKLVISYDSLGTNVIATLLNPTYNLSQGVYTYTIPNGVDLSSLSEGSSTVYAVGFSSDVAVSSVSNILVVDRTSPQVDLIMPAIETLQIYTDDSFLAQIQANDASSNMNRVEFYLGNTLLFNSTNLTNLRIPVLSSLTTGSYCNLKNCSGTLELEKLSVNTNYNFTLKAYDIYGNVNSDSIYYSKSLLSYLVVFSGDIVTQRGFDLYTNAMNPKINMTFNSTSIRNYTCNISVIKNSLNLKKQFVATNNELTFNLKDISSSLDLSVQKDVLLSFSCVDNFGLSLIGNYNLYYDNNAPELDSVYLQNGNERNYKNIDNQIYPDIVDNLVFKFNNTGEGGYSCKYKFTSKNSNLYVCDNNWHNFTFSSLSTSYQFTKVVSNVNILSTNENSLFNCYRTSSFSDILPADSDVRTGIAVSAICTDYINLQTDEKKFDLNINYVTSGLLDFKFNLGPQNKAYPTVTSVIDYSSVVITSDALGNNEILTLSSPSYNLVDGSYIYNSSSKFIDYSTFSTGVYTYYAFGKDSSGVKDPHTLNVTFILDKTSPNLDLTSVDNILGEFYRNSVILDMSASDDNSDMNRIELYVNGVIMFNSSNLSSSSSAVVFDTDSNFCVDNSCSGSIIYTQANSINSTYVFKLKAYDVYGNSKEKFLSLTRRDGVVLKFIDSINLKAVNGTTLVTKVNSPIISFKSSVIPDYCDLYPMIDLEWESITGNSNSKFNKVRVENTTTFNVDLSQITGFDLSKRTQINNNIKVSCYYNFKTYTYYSSIYILNSLPDYVLNSSEGFVLNEQPFTTVANVKSVGPYKQLENCTYLLNGNKYIFSQNKDVNFNSLLNFSTLPSGTYDVSLECQDIVENFGPNKKYKFIVNKEAKLALSDIRLEKSQMNYLMNNNIIDVGELGSYTLKFNTNKKIGVNCGYVLDSGLSTFDSMMNFVKNLFGAGRENLVVTDSVYSYEKSINLVSDSSELNLHCDVLGDEDVNLRIMLIKDTSNITTLASMN